MAGLNLSEIRKSYGTVDVIRGVDLDIEEGEFIVFVGPSGCGKSTLLRMIAGLEEISGGELKIDGIVVNDIPPSKRGIAMVFQSYALYPHMTVYENMAFGMRIAKADPAEIDRRVREAAGILQLEPYLDRLPKALSGGQRQRVAIGRAIVRNPKVFLFDEPLSNLDAALRVATRIEIAKLHESIPNSTMIYVTHDQVEAMTLADRIVVLSGGNIEQVGSPLELYDNPGNMFVAQFIGSPAMNIVPAKLVKSGTKTTVELPDGHMAVIPVKSAKSLEGSKVSFGVRPEDLYLATDSKSVLDGRVSLVESLGEVTVIYVDVAGRDEPLIAKLAGTHHFERDAKIKLTAEPEKMHIFDSNGISLNYL
jgi:alpha-glucoside transport system ATP-binding protein